MSTLVFRGGVVTRQTTGALPVVPYEQLTRTILGTSYDLSIVFTDRETATRLNQTYKKHSGPANILSFPLSETSGEIFISLDRARSDARTFGHSYHEHLLYLLIHGMLHLAGHVHGSTMEREERRFMNRFIKKV